MAQSTAQRDPSMEEILASIRRIIEEGEEARKPAAEARGAFEPTVIGPAANDASRRPLSSAPELSREVPAVEPVDPEPFMHELDVTDAQAFSPAGISNDSFVIERAVDELSLALDDFTIDLDDVKEAREPNFEDEAAFPKDATNLIVESEPAPTADEVRVVPELAIPAKPDPMPSQPEFNQPSNAQPEPAPEIRPDVTSVLKNDIPVTERRPTVQIAATIMRPRKTHPVAQVDDVAKPGQVEPETQKADQKSSILSHMAERQVAASFTELNEVLAASRNRSLDQVAEEMLRPMLQDWLDNNLPMLVERLVREEIERVARGAA